MVLISLLNTRNVFNILTELYIMQDILHSVEKIMSQLFTRPIVTPSFSSDIFIIEMESADLNYLKILNYI